MNPVLFNIFGQPISSFGFFLLFAFLISSFYIWRLVRRQELSEERCLDMILLTFFGGLIIARVYYVLFHLDQFNNVMDMLLINKYPGLSFWGGIIGGLGVLWLLSRRFKINFWMVADFAMVGLFFGIFLTSIGCLMGSCQYGLPYSGWLSISQVGIVGRRFPLQVVEALIFLYFFWVLYRSSFKYHFNGKIAAKGLILLGSIKFVLEWFRGYPQMIFGVPAGFIWSLFILGLGVCIFYRQGKRSFVKDIQFVLKIPSDRRKANLVATNLAKNWYNFKVNRRVGFTRLRKSILKTINVKSNPTKF